MVALELNNVIRLRLAQASSSYTVTHVTHKATRELHTGLRADFDPQEFTALVGKVPPCLKPKSMLGATAITSRLNELKKAAEGQQKAPLKLSDIDFPAFREKLGQEKLGQKRPAEPQPFVSPPPPKKSRAAAFVGMFRSG